jgi:hypothetical protein
MLAKIGLGDGKSGNFQGVVEKGCEWLESPKLTGFVI